jgi:hypothetical protein
MALVKATGIGYIKTSLRKADKTAEQALLAQLSEEEIRLFQTHLPVSWVPVEFVSKLYEITVPLMYPGDARGLQRWGRKIANDDFMGIYRILLRIVTISYFIKQTAKLWGTFHKQGKAWVEKSKGENTAIFHLSEYPDLPSVYRNILEGYLLGCVELAGGKEVCIQPKEEKSHDWQWVVQWK